MQLKHFFSTLLAAATVSAYAIRAAPEVDTARLAVDLEPVGNTLIKARVTNEGPEDITILKVSSILDDAPCRKVQVEKDGKPLVFEGIDYHHDLSLVPEDGYITLKPSESVINTFDLATTTDLSKGGSISVYAKGFFYVSSFRQSEISGLVRYTSNTLQMNVDATLASQVKTVASFYMYKLNKRTTWLTRPNGEALCNEEQKAKLTTVLKVANEYAKAGLNAAKNNKRKLEEYFISSKYKEEIIKRYQAYVKESESVEEGVVKVACNPPGSTASWSCRGNATAFAVFAAGYIQACEPFFKFPLRSPECHKTDQGHVWLHEISHIGKVYQPGTYDWGYGYKGLTKLTDKEASTNADTYGLFGADMARGCK